MRRTGTWVALLVAALATAASSQERPLAIVSATPEGQLDVIDDASDIRIVFSEAMVPVGANSGQPSWLSITPRINAQFYWVGTRTLIAAFDSHSPPRWSTEYTVQIAATARSISGKT